MADIFPGSVVLKNNPVTKWEKYSRTWSADPAIQSLSCKESADVGPEAFRMIIGGDVEELREIFTNGLGRHIDVAMPYGPVFWDGQATKLVLKVGPLELSRNLNEVWNSIWLRYRTIGGTSTARSTTVNDTPSQARYGIREFVGTVGEVNSLAQADQLANRYLDYNAMPRVYMAINPSVGRASEKNIGLEIAGKGYFDTLNWKHYNQTASTGTKNADLVVDDIITAVGAFVASSRTDTNATPTPKVYDIDRKGGEIIRSIAGMGDSSYNRWICRMNVGREFVFQQAASPAITATAVKFRLNAFDDPLVIHNHLGRAMQGYEIVPNTWLRARGALLASGAPASLLEDAEAAYIETVDRNLMTGDFQVLTSRLQRGDVMLARAASGTGA